MPEVSRFYGIVITMYYDEHNPPHFHARYGGEKAVFDIATLQLLEGSLPPRARGLVVEWAALHSADLMNNWLAARQDQPLSMIDPLG